MEMGGGSGGGGGRGGGRVRLLVHIKRANCSFSLTIAAVYPIVPNTRTAKMPMKWQPWAQ